MKKDKKSCSEVLEIVKLQENGGPIGYRRDPNDCHKFYQCTQGKWISKTCPAKLYWNAETITCDWFTDKLCKNDIIPVLL